VGPSKKYDIVTPFDLCVDYIVDCGDILPDFNQKEQLIQDYRVELGGSTCIFACQAAKLGLHVLGLGQVGTDLFGSFVVDRIRTCGVDVSHILENPALRTGMGLALTRPNDRAILTYTGSIDGAAGEDFTDEVLQSSRHLHIGSFFLMTRLQPFYKEIIPRAKSYGLTISLDTNWDPEENWDSGMMEWISNVDIFLPNEQEALSISGQKDLESAVQFLSDLVKIVVIKMGQDGAMVASDGRRYYGTPPEIRNIADTIGAGDNFDAGFIYSYLKGHDLNRCLKTGILCGSRSITEMGGITGQIGIKDLPES
jgi:sugar/nucleoside kinase (ribokinase family)